DGSSIASKKSTAPLLITPGDFNEPLPDRVGNMILDKKRKQWVNVNEYIPVEEDSDGNTRQLQSRYKAYSRSSTGVDRGGARSVYNNNSGGESSAPMLFGPESHRRGTIHTSNSYSKMNKDSDIKGYIASVSEEYFYNALNKKTMLATISDAGFEERKSSESEKRRNKSFAGEIDSLRKIIMTDNNLMHLNNKYFADTIERGLGRQETKRPPKINFTIDTNYNEQQGRDGAQELEDTLFSKIRSRNIAGEHLTILNLSGCGLRSLVGLSKHQPMLEYLNIQNNKISSVEGIPEDLVNLEAKNNWISFNDGKKFRLRDKLPHLEVVDMSNNQVSDIGVFSGLLHLRVLIIDKNQISTLSPLGRCTRLRKLSLAGNFVTQFDLDLREKMPRLEELDLSNNRIESLEAFTRFSSIKVLNLEANDIRNIGGTILTMPKLTALNLANNPKLFSSRSEALEALIRPEIFPALKTLRVDGCLLKTARSAIPKLQKLLIRGNLKTLDKPLEIYLDNTSLFSLKQLVISNRMLSIVDSMVNNSGWCMASLTRLELTFCGLTSLPSNFSQLFANLELLDISGNTDLHELPMGLINLHRLKVLRCQYTAIGCRDTLPAHKHSKGSLNSVYTTDLHKSADDSFVSDSSRISQHQLWPQLLSKKILSNMKNLVELDFRGCPLTQLIYSSKDPTPFTHFLNLISRPSMAATSLLKKNNQLNLLNSYSIKPLSRTHISEFDLDLLCQIESLFVCRQSVLDSLLSSPDLQILTPSVSSFSPSQLPAPSPLSDYHGDVAKNRHFSNSYSVYSAYSQSPISPPSSIASVSSSFSSTSSLNNFYTKPQLSSIANDKKPIPPTPSLYPYPSKSSSYELDSFYALDRSHCLLLEKSTLGSNLLFYRDFYRINVKNILPNLKFLDGLPTSV
ncbi:Septation initiation network scaffold protein cdc11, partial [Zancudomyces culisetae]